jgi:hypothetical protein
MSLASSRVSLIHSCAIERDANASSADSWGAPNSPDWQSHLADLPCRAWAVSGREIIADKASVVVADEIRMIVQVGTDVTERDRVNTITYRGATVFAGPMGIRAVDARRDHLELTLARITG